MEGWRRRLTSPSPLLVLCASRFHYSSHLLLEGRNSRNDVEGLSTWGQCWCGLFFFCFLPFSPWGCLFEICTVGPSFFPYLCLCLSPERLPDKVRDVNDVKTSSLTKNAISRSRCYPFEDNA